MPKSVDDVILGALSHSAYDPQKAHEYYMKTRKLHPREAGGKVVPLPKKGSSSSLRNDHPAPPHQPVAIPAAVQQKINSLKVRLATLEARLKELLKNKTQDAKKSDHKTAAEKSKDARASKQYRDKHKTELANKRKQDAGKSGGGGSSKSSISSMTESEVRTAIARTRSELQAAVASARAAANRGTA